MAKKIKNLKMIIPYDEEDADEMDCSYTAVGKVNWSFDITFICSMT